MNFVIFIIVVDHFYAENINITDTKNYQRSANQQFIESLKIYPERLDALHEARSPSLRLDNGP